jgi:starch synthase
MKKKRRILFLTTEIAPFNAESPLSEMSLHLTRIYRSLGHDIRVIMPKYNFIRERKHNLREVIRLREIPVPIAGKLTWMSVKSGFVPDTKVQVYFLEHEKYFLRDGILHDPATGKFFPDNDERFIGYCRAAVEMLRILSWQPQVIHCTDWTCALTGYYLRTMYNDNPFFHTAKIVLSLTDYENSGAFPHSAVFKAGFNPEEFKSGSDLELKGEFNFLKLGISKSDKVIINGDHSLERYSDPFKSWLKDYVQEHPSKFVRLHLGVDHHIWNPDKDDKLPVNYSYHDFSGKKDNKIKLIEKYGLKVDPEAPLFACAWDNCGFEELKSLVALVKTLNGALIVMNKRASEEQFDAFLSTSPENLGAVKLITGITLKQLMAGADCIIFAETKAFDTLHLKALKYGAIPIVPKTGFFADDLEDDATKGYAFFYEAGNYRSMMPAVNKSLETYKVSKGWSNLVKRALKYDSSWNRFARSVTEVYDSID